MNEDQVWKKCSNCKKSIPFGATYWICNVSTCNRKRTGLSFCTVACWDAHVPVMNHREAWAEEKKAPKSAEAALNPEKEDVPLDEEILVVITKVKKYIADRADMNTSAQVMGILSDRIRRCCDKAMETAKDQGRVTVLDRDLPDHL